MNDKQVFKCSRCGHGQFKETYDDLYMCKKCHLLYIPETMQAIKMGASSYSYFIAPPPELNKLNVRVDKYMPGNDDIARG